MKKNPEEKYTPLIAGAVEKICAELAEDSYQVGEKLPTFREWSKKYKVSLYAAQRALQHLKELGIISSREGSYTYLARKPGPAASPPKISAPARITIWQAESNDMRKVQQDMLKSRFHRMFMEAHPGTEILVEYTGDPPPKRMLRLLHEWQDRKGPTFANFTATYLDFLDEHHLISLIAAEDLSGPVREEFMEYGERLLPQVRDMCLRRDPESSGTNRFGLVPDAITLPLLTYFKPLFQQCGLDKTRTPLDWDELLATARHIKKRLSVTPLHFASEVELVWWYFHLEAQAAPIIGQPVPEAIFHPGASGTQAIEYLCTLHREGLLEIHDGHQAADFHSKCLSGQIPMLVSTQSTPSLFFYLDDAASFGIGALPVGPNRKVSGFLNVGGNALRAGLTPEEKSASIQYLIGWERFAGTWKSRKSIQRKGLTPSPLQPWADRAISDKIPGAWQDVLHAALENSLGEPQGADMCKSSLRAFFAERFRGAIQSSPEELLHRMRLELSENGLWN